MTLLAPAPSAAALLGRGPSDVQRIVDWERADVAALMSEGTLPAGLARDLGGHDEAVAFSRSASLVAHLRAAVGRVADRDPRPPPGLHAARWLAGVTEAFGLDPSADPPPCASSPEEERLARPWRERLPAGFLALHPGSGSARKNWPADRFLDLADRLSPERPRLVVCGPADRDAVDPFRRRPDYLVVEDLPVRALGTLLSAAGLFVGNDSGVTHLAAAWSAPTLALFAPTDPRVWSPEGVRVRTLQSPTPEMTDLTLEEVLSKTASL